MRAQAAAATGSAASSSRGRDALVTELLTDLREKDEELARAYDIIGKRSDSHRACGASLVLRFVVSWALLLCVWETTASEWVPW